MQQGDSRDTVRLLLHMILAYINNTETDILIISQENNCTGHQETRQQQEKVLSHLVVMPLTLSLCRMLTRTSWGRCKARWKNTVSVICSL